MLLKSRPAVSVANNTESFCCTHCGGCDYATTLNYGCSEAYRWNGSYVFYCPCGYTFICASVTDEQGLIDGGIVLGPVIMGSLSDTYDMSGIPVPEGAESITVWSAERVHHAQGIVRAMASAVSPTPQNLLGGYMFEQDKILSELYVMKNEWPAESAEYSYLLQQEAALKSCIANHDKEAAQKLLNKMLGYIYLIGNADLPTIRARLIEMIVLLSRSAIDAGASIEEILLLNKESLRQIGEIRSIEDLSAWSVAILHRFIQYSFDFSAVKHSDVMFKVIQYVKANYDKHIGLDDIAVHVCLSRSYLSSMFKDEMGEGLISYINRVRVENSKLLILNESLSLVTISGMCGFEDQSYFTKVFKSFVGISPKRYRTCRGMLHEAQFGGKMPTDSNKTAV